MKKTVILHGAGTSINEGLEKGLYQKIKNEEIWSLNFAFKTMPYLPDRELWVDNSFFRKNAGAIQTLHKQGVLLCARENSTYAFFDAIKQFKGAREEGNLNKGDLYLGRNGLVGFFALSLACEEGYKNIYLLGFDYGVSDGKNKNTHYYQGKIKVQSSGMGDPLIYHMMDGKVNKDVKCFDFYKKYDSNIYNVSPNSNIYQFPKITYEEFFERIKNK